MYLTIIHNSGNVANLLKGADFESPNKNSDTPVNPFAENGQQAAANLLKGANFESSNKDVDTPIDSATYSGGANTYWAMMN